MRLFKRAIRRIAPLAASALMLGSSVGFASAADLNEFPQPFVTVSGDYQGAIVLGTGATGEGAALDNAAATAINGALRVPVDGGSGSTVVSGGEGKDIPIGYGLGDSTYGWGSAITDSDIPSLYDDTISVQIGDVSGDYDVHEEVVFSAGLAVRTGLNITTPDDEYKDKPFIEVLQKSVTYRYAFDESVKTGNYLSNATTDDPVTLNILGKEVEVTAATTTSLTANVGEKFTLAVGESKEIASKTVTLVEVGSDGSIRVDVGGESKIIGSGNTNTVGGLRVKNHARIYTTASGGVSQATVIAGSKTSETFNTGDEFIGQDENDPDWIWQIDNLGTASNDNVTWDQVWTDSNEVLYEGDTFSFPDNYVTLKFDSLTDGVWRDYILEKTTVELYNSTGKQDTGGTGSEPSWNTSAVPVLTLKAVNGEDDAIKFPSSGVVSQCQGKETDQVFIRAARGTSGVAGDGGYIQTYGNNVTVYWKDSNDGGKAKFCGSATSAGPIEPTTTITLTLQHDDATFNFDIGASTGNSSFNDTSRNPQLRFILGRGEQQYVNLTANVSAATGSIGFEDGWTTISGGGTAVSTNVRAVGSMGPNFKDIGTWEENTLTVDGLKLYDPDANGDSNKFKFGVPRDENIDFRANIQVYGTSVETTRGGSSFTGAPTDLPLLDSEVLAGVGQSGHMIVIGGTCVNKVSAAIANVNYPTCGDAATTALGFGESEAVLKLYDSPYAAGKFALLVAGWEGIDTARAGRAIAKGVPSVSGQEAVLVTATETVTKKA